MPYILDGDIKISESMAIMRHIVNRSEKKDLLGKNLKDQCLIDNMIPIFSSMLSTLISQVIYNPEGNQNITKAQETLAGKFEQIGNIVQSKDWTF